MECLSIIADVNRQRWEPSSFFRTRGSCYQVRIKTKVSLSYPFSNDKTDNKETMRALTPFSFSRVEFKFYKHSFLFSTPSLQSGILLELIVRKKRKGIANYDICSLITNDSWQLRTCFLEVVTENGKDDKNIPWVVDELSRVMVPRTKGTIPESCKPVDGQLGK